MGRIISYSDQKQKDKIEKSLANWEIGTDGGQEKTHLGEAKTCPDLEIISKEIRELTTEIKDAFHKFGEIVTWERT